MIKGAREHTNCSAKCCPNDRINGIMYAHVNLRQGNDKRPGKAYWKYRLPTAVKYQDQKDGNGEVVGCMCRRKAVARTAVYPVYDQIRNLKVVARSYTANKRLDEP